MINYTQLSPKNAAELLALQLRLDSETPYMLYLPNERITTVAQTEKILSQLNASGFIIGAWSADKELVGYLSAERATQEKISHTVYIVVGVTKQASGQGVGTQLFKQLELWAIGAGIHRLELTVIANNRAAKHLYDKSGFEVEGVKRDSIAMDGLFFDEYYMAKLLP